MNSFCFSIYFNFTLYTVLILMSPGVCLLTMNVIRGVHPIWTIMGCRQAAVNSTFDGTTAAAAATTASSWGLLSVSISSSGNSTLTAQLSWSQWPGNRQQMQATARVGSSAVEGYRLEIGNPMWTWTDRQLRHGKATTFCLACCAVESALCVASKS